MTTLDDYQKALDALTAYQNEMVAKYKTPRWDQKCTNDEWTQFIGLVRTKDKLEKKIEKEEEGDE